MLGTSRGVEHKRGHIGFRSGHREYKSECNNTQEEVAGGTGVQMSTRGRYKAYKRCMRGNSKYGVHRA